MCKERRYVLMANLVKFLANVANVARPTGKQTDVPSILADRVGGPAVGLELDKELLERLSDAHGATFLELELGLSVPPTSDLTH